METWKESQLKKMAHARSTEDAYSILLNFAQNLGFKYCGVSITLPHCETPSTAMQKDNYPEKCRFLYDSENYIIEDPIQKHCRVSVMPIIWNSELFSREMWQALRASGLGNAWSQSYHDDKTGLHSIISLAGSHCSISPDELYGHFGYIFYAAYLFCELYVRFTPMPARPGKPRLSARELEILKYSANGKTAYEISRICGVSERTVNYHVQQIMAKFNVCNKISAVMAAARAGLI